MKKLIFIVLMFIFISGMKAFDNTQKIYDYSQVLTTKEELKLRKKANKFINDYNMDIVIVTVKHYKSNSSIEYASEFYNYNNFGKNNNRSGIIMVIDLMNDKKTIIIKPYGDMEKYYTNIITNELIKNIKSINNYYDASKYFINQTSKIINNKNINKYNILYNLPIVLIFVISFILSTIIIIILYLIVINNKKNKSLHTYNNLVITKLKDEFINSNTTHKIIK